MNAAALISMLQAVAAPVGVGAGVPSSGVKSADGAGGEAAQPSTFAEALAALMALTGQAPAAAAAIVPPTGAAALQPATQPAASPLMPALGAAVAAAVPVGASASAADGVGSTEAPSPPPSAGALDVIADGTATATPTEPLPPTPAETPVGPPRRDPRDEALAPGAVRNGHAPPQTRATPAVPAAPATQPTPGDAAERKTTLAPALEDELAAAPPGLAVRAEAATQRLARTPLGGMPHARPEGGVPAHVSLPAQAAANRIHGAQPATPEVVPTPTTGGDAPETAETAAAVPAAPAAPATTDTPTVPAGELAQLRARPATPAAPAAEAALLTPSRVPLEQTPTAAPAAAPAAATIVQVSAVVNPAPEVLAVAPALSAEATAVTLAAKPQAAEAPAPAAEAASSGAAAPAQTATGGASQNPAQGDGERQPATAEAPAAEDVDLATAQDTTFEPAATETAGRSEAVAEGRAQQPVRPTAETMTKLAAQIAKRLDGRSTRFEISLDPAGLGAVQVSVEINGRGELTAHMAFDRAESASELRSRAAELQRALEQAGFDLSRGGLSFEERSAGQGRGRGEERRHEGRAFELALQTAEEADLGASAGSYLQRHARTSVNVII